MQDKPLSLEENTLPELARDVLQDPGRGGVGWKLVNLSWAPGA